MTTNWTPEQQKEHRRLWVEALRSGKYRQAKGRLRDGDAFCCLGVACDISGLGKWTGEASPYYLDEHRMLPPKVKDWLGLAGLLGRIGTDDDTRDDLAGMNDDGTPFSVIADIIESEPAGMLEKRSK